MRLYEIVLSTKNKVTIDEEDYAKFKSFSSQGNFVALKMGVVNPSFVVAILPIGEDNSESISGYVDEEKGVFVATKIQKENTPLIPQFNNETKSIADKFKV